MRGAAASVGDSPLLSRANRQSEPKEPTPHSLDRPPGTTPLSHNSPDARFDMVLVLLLPPPCQTKTLLLRGNRR